MRRLAAAAGDVPPTPRTGPDAHAADGEGTPNIVSPPDRNAECARQLSATLAELKVVMEQAGVRSDLCTHVQSYTGALEQRLHRLESEVGTLRVEREVTREKLEQVEKLAKKKGMFMQIVTDYGLPFVVLWGGLWLGMFFSFYALLHYEVLSWQDSLRPWMEHFGYSVDGIDPRMGNAVIAFIVNEALEGLRFAFALATLKPLLRMVAKLRGV